MTVATAGKSAEPKLIWASYRYGWTASYHGLRRTYGQTRGGAALFLYARVTINPGICGDGRYRVAYNDWAKHGVTCAEYDDAVRIVETTFVLDYLEGLL